MSPILSPDVKHRNDFSRMCNRLKLHRALEIGVDRADFSVEFLSRWSGHTMVCVDPYIQYSHMPWNREADFLMAVVRLAPFLTRARLVRATSEEFAHSTEIIDEDATLPNFQPDFVYLDAIHSYESTIADMELWWPKLSSFGVLAGHDYGKNFPGVVKSVNDFAKANGRTIYLTSDFPQSWYLFKTE